jgi:CHAT domain
MPPTRQSAAPEPQADAVALARRRIFWLGALSGGFLALLGVPLLGGELQTLKLFLLLLSALGGGLAALGASTCCAGLAGTVRDVAIGRRLRATLVVLALGVILLLGLDLRFAVRRAGSAEGTQRAALLSPDSRIRSCGKDCWIVELALVLSYLLTLGSAGTVVGLLMIQARRQAPAAPQAPPSSKGYLDFDVWIDQKPEGLYRVKAWSDDAGFEATECFFLPADLAGGDRCRFCGAAEAADADADGITPERIGDVLFRAVFQGDILKAFQGCLAKSRGGPGLRIRLRLNEVPHLAGLPWEYLYDAESRGFLALSGRTPVVRYPELSEGLGTLLVEPPLRVLAVISTPRGYRELAEADEEWRRLGAALEPLLASGLIEVERLESTTLGAMEARLRTGEPVHVLHFVGHGGFSKLRGEGVLVFEDEDGNGVPVGGQSLAYLIQDHPSLRLAVLNACYGARSSYEDTFAGTAQVLVQHGVPAVIAMQSEVMDETAVSFTEKFYRALAAGLPVDACIGEVRKALAAEGNPEWGTPVLYLRATDGRLFDLESGGCRN